MSSLGGASMLIFFVALPFFFALGTSVCHHLFLKESSYALVNAAFVCKNAELHVVTFGSGGIGAWRISAYH